MEPVKWVSRRGKGGSNPLILAENRFTGSAAQVCGKDSVGFAMYENNLNKYHVSAFVLDQTPCGPFSRVWTMITLRTSSFWRRKEG